MGATRAGLEALWAPVSRSHSKALYTKDRILAFATGKPSDGFGDRYLPFDEGRFIARLPAPPYSFLDRIVRAFRTMNAGLHAISSFLFAATLTVTVRGG